MTPEILAGLVGVGISLLFKFVTPLDEWLYYKVADKYRGLAMLGIVVGVSGVIFGLGCLNILNLLVACTWGGLDEFVKSLFIAMATNQISFLVSKVQIAKKVISDVAKETTAEIAQS